MTPEQLAAIEARDGARTPGEWTAARDHLGHWRILWPHSRNSSVMRNGKVFSDDDIAFIAACSVDVPALCAALRAAWAEVERLRAIVREIPADY